MSGLLDLLSQHLGNDAIQKMSTQLGADPSSTKKAISEALPTLLSSLSNQASTSPEKATHLFEQVQGGQAGGADLLSQLLGDRQESVLQGISKSSGLDTNQAGSLFSMLAPIVMGLLSGKGGNDASPNLGALSQLAQQVQKGDLDGKGLLGLLDTDGDGDIKDDVLKIGSSIASSGMLGKLFGR